MSINFSYQKQIQLPEKQRLRHFLSSILHDSARTAGGITIIFCDDHFLLNLNRQYLKHNYFTDILTFNYTKDLKQVIEAELYISVDRVFENSKKLNVHYLIELHRVIFHGFLHLCGFDDKTKTLKGIITEKENYYLNNYFNVPR